MLDRLRLFMDCANLNNNKVTVDAGLSIGLIGRAFKQGKGLHSDSIEKILYAYPDLNPTWLMTGRGEMTLSGEIKSTPNTTPNCTPNIKSEGSEERLPKRLPNSPPNSEIQEDPLQNIAAEGEQQYGYVTKLEYNEMVAEQFMSTGARIRAAILELEGKLAASAPPKDPASTGSIPEKAPQKQEPKE